MEHFSSACMTDSFEEFSEVASTFCSPLLQCWYGYVRSVDNIESILTRLGAFLRMEQEIALAFDRERYGRDCPRATGSGSSSSRYFTKYLKEMCNSVV